MKKHNTEISERLRQIIEYLGINTNSFAKNLGYNRSQAVYDMLNCKSAPSYDFFSRFVNTEYFDIISVDWFLSGRGEMLKKDLVSSDSLKVSDGCVSKELYNDLLESNGNLHAENAVLKYQMEDLKQQLARKN